MEDDTVISNELVFCIAKIYHKFLKKRVAFDKIQYSLYQYHSAEIKNNHNNKLSLLLILLVIRLNQKYLFMRIRT